MVSIEEFQKVWEDSSGPRDVARKTGMKIETVYARAVRYRKRGIALKRFRLPSVSQNSYLQKCEAINNE